MRIAFNRKMTIVRRAISLRLRYFLFNHSLEQRKYETFISFVFNLYKNGLPNQLRERSEQYNINFRRNAKSPSRDVTFQMNSFLFATLIFVSRLIIIW